ncbi:hypothetical protein QOT17_007149 [Balamuthia mandrillaris]
MVEEDKPCYLLVKVTSPVGWLLVSYVPDTISVSQKMVYAASKSRLREELGTNSFVQELHANIPGELSWAAFKGSKSVEGCYSDKEIAVSALNQMENEARKEYSSRAQEINSHSNSKSSGFHTVTIPFNEEATAALRTLVDGSANWIQLKISEQKDAVEVVETKTIQPSELQANIVSSEPRFYFYRKNSPSSVSNSYQSSPAASKTLSFIYCCPEGCPPKLRMVYSTAKPSIPTSAQRALNGHTNFLLKGSLEISDASDLTEQALEEAARKGVVSTERLNRSAPSSSAWGGGRGGASSSVNSSQAARLSVAHPVYSQGVSSSSGGGAGRAGSKRIIIPPAAAWGSGAPSSINNNRAK